MCETFKSKLCEANILDECVVEFPDEGPVVDECAEGSAVVEGKLEVLGSPDEMEQVKLPAECTVVVAPLCWACAEDNHEPVEANIYQNGVIKFTFCKYCSSTGEKGIHTSKLLRYHKTTCNDDMLTEITCSKEPCESHLINIRLLLNCFIYLIGFYLHISSSDSFQHGFACLVAISLHHIPWGLWDEERSNC